MNDNNLKIALMGPNNSGKTSFLLKYTTDTLPSEFVPSTITETIEKQIIYQNKSIKIELFDTYNEEKVSNIKYPKNADFYLILFEIIENSLDNLKQYIDLFPPEKILLVGTKIGDYYLFSFCLFLIFFIKTRFKGSKSIFCIYESI
eukprot:TRINITY_DN5571_c0_g1_i3.p1 TRINITY_DN5571_c0_g1~~TRINITY_DN5571_c0_g1_i3.p1  ORF type:complete len:146 (-),score=14.36 TRINITY_DN5571_c0_g1_i3:225-662(-)